MGQEEHGEHTPHEKYSESPSARPSPRRKRFFPSLSLQRASYDPYNHASSPYIATQPSFAPPPSSDDMPTLPVTRAFAFSSKQVMVIVIGVVAAMLLLFVAVSAVWHGKSLSQAAHSPSSFDRSASLPAAQRTATAVAIITNPGGTPSLGTPVLGVPTSVSTPVSTAAATITPVPTPVTTVVGHPTNPPVTPSPYPIIQPSPNDRWTNINVANAALSVNGYRLSVVVQADIDDCYKLPGQSYCGDYRSEVVLSIPDAASNHGSLHVTHYVSNCANGCPVVIAPLGNWDISKLPYSSSEPDALIDNAPLYFYKCAYADATFSQNGQQILRATTSWQCLNS